eukprot:gene13454-biopygen11069
MRPALCRVVAPMAAVSTYYPNFAWSTSFDANIIDTAVHTAGPRAHDNCGGRGLNLPHRIGICDGHRLLYEACAPESSATPERLLH